MTELILEISAADLRAKLGIKDGAPGQDATVDYEKLKREVLASVVIPKPEKGKDATPVDEEKLYKKVLKEALKRLPEQDTMNQVGYASGGANQLRYLSNGVVVSDHVTELNFSTGVTPVYAGSGRITITGTASTTTYTETPTGTINGSNVTFTTLHTITTVLNFDIGGQYIHPVEYSVSGTTITFVTPPPIELASASFTMVYV